ncbi:MAG: hypothetical protein C0621_07045 [Desulfuromonas sp.]|nr:MAG: hypothetical protein C0621_07045 [Desulfuromonas sp.]
MQTFRIRKAFLIPLGLLLLLCLTLLGVCIVHKEPLAKCLILIFLLLPIVVLFLESLFRRIEVDKEHVVAHRLLRRKRLAFAELSEIETVMVKRRAFITLCAGDDFLIISNAYSRFPELVAALLAPADETVVSETTREMAKEPPMKSSDIVSAWLAVGLLLFILYSQLVGHV